ncbi:MAG TPA: hypothetical protein VGB09_10645 [Candidatus Binatia bacterium]|jgi:hypothetical protein
MNVLLAQHRKGGMFGQERLGFKPGWIMFVNQHGFATAIAAGNRELHPCGLSGCFQSDGEARSKTDSKDWAGSDQATFSRKVPLVFRSASLTNFKAAWSGQTRFFSL